MADEADQANDWIERDLQLAREAVAASTQDALYSGICLDCGEPLEAPRRFCDAACRDLWQARKKTR